MFWELIVLSYRSKHLNEPKSFLLSSNIWCCISRLECKETNGNVLIIGPLDTGTHMLSMSPFAVELSKAGYNVSIFEWNYTPTPRDLGPNVEVFHVHENRPDGGLWKARAMQTFTRYFTGWIFLHVLPTFNEQIPRLMEFHSNVVLEIMNRKWDLIVVDELFAVHGMAMAAFFRKEYGIPYAIYATTQMTAVDSMYFGLSKSYVAAPYFITREAAHPNELFDQRKFWHRLVNAWDSSMDLVGNALFDWRFGTNGFYFGVDNFEFSRYFRGASLVITDYYTRWAFPIPETTKFRNMATNCKVAKQLPTDLLEFVEDPKSKGTIYIAFGTAVQWEFAPERILNAFFTAIERLAVDYRVIFAYNGAERNVSENIRLIRWAPQFDILSHKRTRVYVTHGGLKSSKESVCAKVPVVYMPLYAEQTYNMHTAVTMGFALPLNKHTVDEVAVESAIREVSENKKFKENVVRAHKLAFDRPVNAVQEVLQAVKRTIKSRGNGRPGRRGIDFDNQSGRVRTHQHFYLDFLAFIFVLLYVVYRK
ncbi:UDP-glucuronosyltransferase [Aphelenchoides besseyi]|nr:UDP-glucuronosyltransferase [Aphelenchoides besseyi]